MGQGSDEPKDDRWAEWKDQIEELRNEWGEDAAQELELRLKDTQAKPPDPDKPGPSVGYALCNTQWRTYERRVLATKPSSNLFGRFKDALTIAIEHRKEHGEDEYITPPLWNKSKFLVDNLEDLRQEVLRQRWDLAMRAWDTVIQGHREAGNEDTAKVFESGKNMQNARRVDLEAIPRWPDEAPGYEKKARDQMTKEERAKEDLDFTLSLGFDDERINIPQKHWSFKEVLGRGSFGIATLWVRYDMSGRIIDRIVIKQNIANPAMWDWAKTWYGDKSNRIPMEYHLNTQIATKADAFNVVQCRTYATYDNHKVYRLYLEYCPHGTLLDMTNKYRQHGNFLDPNGVAFKEGNRHLIPSRIIWTVFEALASAACLMHDGHLPYQDEHTAFQPFIHRDIKPENVFLSAPDQLNWREIPTPKLADFGLAIHTKDSESQKPGTGTSGFMAPEQYAEERSHSKFKVSRKSDIWAIGRTILCMMNCEYGGSVEKFTFGSPSDYPDYAAGVEEFYPEALRDVLTGCLDKDPVQRYSAKDLWEEIHVHVAALQGLSGDVNTILKLQNHNPERQLLLYDEDRHRLWAR